MQKKKKKKKRIPNPLQVLEAVHALLSLTLIMAPTHKSMGVTYANIVKNRYCGLNKKYWLLKQ